MKTTVHVDLIETLVASPSDANVMPESVIYVDVGYNICPIHVQHKAKGQPD